MGLNPAVKDYPQRSTKMFGRKILRFHQILQKTNRIQFATSFKITILRIPTELMSQSVNCVTGECGVGVEKDIYISQSPRPRYLHISKSAQLSTCHTSPTKTFPKLPTTCLYQKNLHTATMVHFLNAGLLALSLFRQVNPSVHLTP